MADIPQRRRTVEVLAMLIATQSYSDEEIGAAMGMPPSRISTLKGSPRFQTRVMSYTPRFATSSGADVVGELIRADTVDNVQLIKDIRSGSVDKPPSVLQTQLRAAEMLLDRQAPKRQETTHHGAPKVIIHLDAKKFDLLRGTLDEDDLAAAIDVEQAHHTPPRLPSP